MILQSKPTYLLLTGEERCVGRGFSTAGSYSLTFTLHRAYS